MLKDIFGRSLPSNLNCYELFTDSRRFTSHGLLEVQPGDLVWFGPTEPRVELDKYKPEFNEDRTWLENYRDFAINHVAIALDEAGSDMSSFDLLHSNYQDGTVSIWPFDRFMATQRYSRVYGVTRLMVESPV